MHSLVIKPAKKTLSKSQSAFNRLIKKIEKMQRSITETETMLNQTLDYYRLHVCPVKEKMLEKLSECIPIFYAYYKHSKSKFSKKQHEALKELIQSLLAELGENVMPHEISEEIIAIVRDIEGVDLKEELASEIEILKKQLFNQAKQQGLDIDLSSINPNDSYEELMAKLQKAMFEAQQNATTGENATTEETYAGASFKEKIKKKTKKQLLKEQQAREIEDLQKKGLSKIYKQLAKTLHPDLELDPVVKVEKEKLMKKLTAAYESQDLHTLLSLEITWMNQATASESGYQEADEQLNTYNCILKNQVVTLQEQLNDLVMHPRYFDIQHILRGYPPSSFLAELKDEEKEISKDLKRYSSAVTDLQDGSNFKEVKQILKEFSSRPHFFEMFDFLMDF
jgi:hypothetical protein